MWDHIEDRAAWIEGRVTPPAIDARRRIARQVRQQRYGLSPDLWTRELADQLAAEATGLCRSGALTAVENDRQRSHYGGGPVLAAVHGARRLLSFVRAISGRFLVPVGSGYHLYRRGDFTGLHVDVQDYEIGLLSQVAGPGHPLILHPDIDPAMANSCHPHPSGGAPICYPPNGVLVIRGRDIAHYRPPWPSDEPGIVLSLGYRSLF